MVSELPGRNASEPKWPRKYLTPKAEPSLFGRRQARQRCWRYDWVLDLDILGFFDNLDQNLLLRAVKKYAPEPWVVLYIERWLKAPMQEEDGRLVPREKGTPQGGVVSPLLSN